MSHYDHFTAAELTDLLGCYDLELLDLVDAGLLVLEADGFTRVRTRPKLGTHWSRKCLRPSELQIETD